MATAPTKAPSRPTLKRTFTATAFGMVTARNAWREYFRGLAAEQRARRAQPRGFTRR